MKKMFLILILCALLAGVTAHAAIKVSSPSSAETVKAAEDYATATFQDPWDMNENTDLGYFIWDVTSGSKSNMSNVKFNNGIFSASSTTTDPNISVLETALPGTCQLGKVGANYKIDASKYKVFAIRMKLNKDHNGMLLWSRNTIYKDYSYSGVFSTHSGWAIYIVNIPRLGYSKVPGYSKGYSWGSNIDSLRFDPASAKVNIEIDWIRLVENASSLYRTVRWSGASGSVNIYLDNDKVSGNGNLGLIAKNVSGSSYSLYAGALAPNVKYYVGVRSSSGGATSYSAGYYKVNDIPTVEFTSPSEEGGTDFATAVLGNAWDMSSTSDLDSYNNLSGAPSITNVSSQDLAGNSLGGVTAITGTSIPPNSGAGDPILTPLWFDGGRGATNLINSSTYRILVLKMSLPGNWDLNGGSVARIYWHVQGEFNGNIEKMNQSADVLVRHKSGTTVMNTIIADLKDLALESSPSTTGWKGYIDGFRVDPHEFTTPKKFYVDSVKVAAFETADSSYTFKWNYSDTIASSKTLSLYRDSNNSGFNGTLIKSGINPANEKYTWNTSKISAGTYYIYAVFNDGRNSNRTYARWPIKISHSGAATAKIQLSRSSLNFGAVSGTSTDNQTFMIENGGTGTMNWNVSKSDSWLSVSPSSGSGSGVVSVGVDASGLARGTYSGTVSVTSSNATNSPQTIAVALTVYKSGTTATPFGEFLTPANRSDASSSIAVTGWALDDVGLDSVKIYSGSQYIGDAVFVEGARDDIAGTYSGYPQNYQAGWGYMLLTNFLPGGGNGTYNLVVKAFDKEGRSTNLGTRTIYVDNTNVVNPFGAIDFPPQGGIISGGSYTNMGWALTPQPNKIPASGSTITVYVDNESLGTVDYNNSRGDIASLFPGYQNTSGAGATFTFDTSKYFNGTHIIYWIAEDNGGNSDGIGSRFFTVQNVGSNRTAESTRRSIMQWYQAPPMDSLFGASASVQSLMQLAADHERPLEVKRGFSRHAAAERLSPGEGGTVTVAVRELEKMEIQLEPGKRIADETPGRYLGYRAAGSRWLPLPVGSTLDTRTGTFTWMPGPGFVGKYPLVFIDTEGQVLRKVTIDIRSAVISATPVPGGPSS